jgi:LysM repeat protein
MADMNLIEYTIQPGDTLWELALEYETTVEAIMAVNPGIEPDNLLVGEMIAIPGPEMDPVAEEQWFLPPVWVSPWAPPVWRRPCWGPRSWDGSWRRPWGPPGRWRW